jgi:hypothetical protein
LIFGQDFVVGTAVFMDKSGRPSAAPTGIRTFTVGDHFCRKTL